MSERVAYGRRQTFHVALRGKVKTHAFIQQIFIESYSMPGSVLDIGVTNSEKKKKKKTTISAIKELIFFQQEEVEGRQAQYQDELSTARAVQRWTFSLIGGRGHSGLLV